MMSSDPDAAMADEATLGELIKVATDAARARPCTPNGQILGYAFAPERPLPDGERGARMRRRAEDIFRATRPGVLKLVLRRLGRGLEVMELVGERVEPVAIRGSDEGGLLVRHRFDERAVTAHVSADASGPGFLLTLDLWASADPRGPRVSLFSAGREVISQRAPHGHVLFAQLPAGDYRVLLSDGGEAVGELDLTFVNAAA